MNTEDNARPYDKLAAIRQDLSIILKDPESNLDKFKGLLSEYGDILSELAKRKQYSLISKTSIAIEELVDRALYNSKVAGLIAEIYLEKFQPSQRAVFTLAESLTGAQREDIISRSVDILIENDACRTDKDGHLAGGVVRKILTHCDNTDPAIRYAEEILKNGKHTNLGLKQIIDTLKECKKWCRPQERINPLIEWMDSNEERLQQEIKHIKPGAIDGESIGLLKEYGLGSLADKLYYKTNELNAGRMIRIFKETGEKADPGYIGMFLNSQKNLSVKEARELLKYSLAVENVFPEDWKGINSPWVATSLASAFTRLSEMNVQPRSPEACEPLISLLAKHLKSEERMSDLLNKRTEPYLRVCPAFNKKMFSNDLGL